MSQLKLPQRQTPYFIAYSLLEVEQQLVVGQLGVVVQSEHQHARSLRPEVRVGTPSMDNSHTMTESGGFGQGNAPLPLDNDELALRTAIWAATDTRLPRRRATARTEGYATRE